MENRILASFVTVAEEGQIARAAAKLHISQPPLSRHIQMLERDLGVVLFRRTTSGMELTDAGRSLYKDAKNIQTYVQEATKRARLVGSGKTGEISVGVYGSSIFGLTTRILFEFKEKHPDIYLNLNYGQTHHQINALRRGQIEVCFERNIANTDDFEVVKIGAESLFIAMHEDHPLSKIEDLSISHLSQEVINIGSDFMAISQTIAWCESAGFTPKLSVPTTSVVTAAMSAAIGQGVSIVPESMINVSFPNVIYRRLSDASHVMNLYCFYRQEQPSPVLQSLLDFLPRA